MSAQPYSDEEIADARTYYEQEPNFLYRKPPTLRECFDNQRRWLATLDATRAQLDAATRERDLWRVRTEKCGVAELGVFNPNVASYCREWEARTEKAETALDAARKALGEVRLGLVKVVAHTGHYPDAARDLLVGLLVSCKRNAVNGLATIDAILKGGA